MTAFFSLKTQFENAGDALINRELLRLSGEQVDVLLDTTRCPPEFVESLRLDVHAPSVRTTTSWGLLRAMVARRLRGRPAYYFLSPGGYVGERRGKAALALLVNTGAIAALRLIGVRVCHVGVSIERLGPLHKRVLQWRSRLLHCLLIRDEASAAYARACDIRSSGLAPDLAFGASAYIAAATSSEKIAVSFRCDQSPSQRDAVLGLLATLNDAVPSGWPVRCVIQVERDAPIMQEVASAIAAMGRPVEIVDVHADVDSALDAYRGCRAVISNRLHALLFGLLSGCEPVAVVDPEHNAKIVGLFDSLGVPSNPFNLTAAVLSERVERPSDRWHVAPAQLSALRAAFAAIFDVGVKR